MENDSFRNELKRIFKGYKKFNLKIERQLYEIGITIARRSNHIILAINDDGIKKHVSISCTGSDKREGLNIVSKIMGIC